MPGLAVQNARPRRPAGPRCPARPSGPGKQAPAVLVRRDAVVDAEAPVRSADPALRLAELREEGAGAASPPVEGALRVVHPLRVRPAEMQVGQDVMSDAAVLQPLLRRHLDATDERRVPAAP